MANKPGTVFLVGAGPGDPGLLTVKGLDCLRQAECIVYDRLVDPVLLKEAGPGCEMIYVGKQAGNHTLPQEEICALLARKAGEYERVVRLKGGDVYVFGRGGEEGEYLKERRIPFEVVPGISSSIAGLAYAGIPITHRGVALGFRVMTAHDKNGGLSGLDFEGMARTEETLVFLMGLSLLGEIRERLLKAGKSPDTPAAVISKATLPGQRTVTGTLFDIESRVAESGISSPALIVVGKVVSLRETLNFFEEKPLFGKKVFLPTSGVKTSALGKLLREKGAMVDEYPTAAIRSLPEGVGETDFALFDVLAFTSQYGVEAFMEGLFAAGKDIRAVAHLQFAAVGLQTKEALFKYGIRADYIPPRHDGESLWALLAETLAPGSRVLWAKPLDSALPAVSGLSVTGVPVYENCPLSDEEKLSGLKAGEYDFLAFTSSSAASRVIGALGAPLSGKTAVFSIGAKTTSTLKELGVGTVIQADDASFAAMAEKICGYAKEQ